MKKQFILGMVASLAVTSALALPTGRASGKPAQVSREGKSPEELKANQARGGMNATEYQKAMTEKAETMASLLPKDINIDTNRLALSISQSISGDGKVGGEAIKVSVIADTVIKLMNENRDAKAKIDRDGGAKTPQFNEAERSARLLPQILVHLSSKDTTRPDRSDDRVEKLVKSGVEPKEAINTVFAEINENNALVGKFVVEFARVAKSKDATTEQRKSYNDAAQRFVDAVVISNASIDVALLKALMTETARENLKKCKG